MIVQLLLKLFRAFAKSNSSTPTAPVPNPMNNPMAAKTPPWMPIAKKYIGFKERPGNRGIDEFVAGSKTGNIGDPWCAIFVNFCLETAGVKGSRSAMARSFEKHPGFVRLDGPAYGAIGTLWRQSRASGLGHVFFYKGHDAKGRIVGIGGNQSDGVNEQVQPANRFNGYYWPKGYPLPKIERIDLASSGASEGTET